MPGLYAGSIIYATGTPGVHFAHGHGGRALGSLGLRILLPMAGALILNQPHSTCEAGPFCVGGTRASASALAGALLAIALDAVMAWDPPLGARLVALVAPFAREMWIRDLDGYVVVLASPDGEAGPEGRDRQ